MKLNFNLFKKNKENEVFKCEHCKMTFQNKEKLDKHFKKAHTGREKPDQAHRGWNQLVVFRCSRTAYDVLNKMLHLIS